MLDEIQNLIQQCNKNKTFGNVLSDLLEDNDISQKEFARRVNYSVAHVNRYIHNQLPDSMSLQDVEAIAVVLDCGVQSKARLVLAFVCHTLQKKGVLSALNRQESEHNL